MSRPQSYQISSFEKAFHLRCLIVVLAVLPGGICAELHVSSPASLAVGVPPDGSVQTINPTIAGYQPLQASTLGVSVASRHSAKALAPYFGPMLAEDIVAAAEEGQVVRRSPLALLGTAGTTLRQPAFQFAGVGPRLQGQLSGNKLNPATSVALIGGMRPVKIDKADRTIVQALANVFCEIFLGVERPVDADDAGADDGSDDSITSLLIMATGSALVWGVLVSLVAVFYYSAKEYPPPPRPGQWFIQMGYWNFHIFQCLHDVRLVCFTCVCSPIRWADNQRMAKFMSFWEAFALITVLSMLSMCGLVIFVPITLAVCVYYRQKMRAMFEIPSGDCQTITNDCCAYAFCSVCAIVQEARQIEMAYLANVHAVNPPPNYPQQPAEP